MRTVHDFDADLQAVIGYDDSGWWIEVNATVNLCCVFGQEHSIHIHANRQVGRHTDPMLLTAFEWAIRGQRHSVLQVATLIIDDEIQAQFIDPCLGE